MENVVSINTRIELSVTNREIANFWNQRRLVEEDHLYAALKAAARIRTRNLTYDEYLQFEESLEEKREVEFEMGTKISGEKYEHKGIPRVGIKDWWTKSKYAYLNEPVTENPRLRSSTAST
ncbi:uncharacterized protein LOC142533687 [Primulina tabacum]|uniref:uncharacterized protein LOC142533687 n=1 Tax=Primulina tabacum TaxID=48773 RepID=UPI003F5A10BC